MRASFQAHELFSLLMTAVVSQANQIMYEPNYTETTSRLLAHSLQQHRHYPLQHIDLNKQI